MFDRAFAFGLFCFLFGMSANAQLDCKTSSFPNYGFNCQQETYDPVCGCDTVTYRNPCDATQLNNVQFIVDGVCPNVDFALDLFPIPATSGNPVRVAIEGRANNPLNLSIFVYDAFGTLHLQRVVSGISRFDWLVPSSSLRPGVYIMVAANFSSGYIINKKFIIADI